LIEPLVILANIKGYKSIDDYVLHLIEYDLGSIRDECQGKDDLGEYVIDYIEKIIVPSPHVVIDKEEDEEED
jgi:hypothetical protein